MSKKKNRRPMELFAVALAPSDVPESGTVRVRVMPFGVPISRGGTQQQFDAGSLRTRDNVPLTVDHGTGVEDRIGVLASTDEDADGLNANLAFADTERANDIRELLRIGAITDVSAGVRINAGKEFTDDLGVLHRFGTLDHISFVVEAAFGESGKGSRVIAVHSTEGETMDEKETAAVEGAAEKEEAVQVEYATAEQVETLRTMVAEMAVPGNVAHRGERYNSLGDLLVDVIKHARKTPGHEAATEALTTRIDGGQVDASGTLVHYGDPKEIEEYEFANVGNSVGHGVAFDPFIPDLLKLLRDGRPTANLFIGRPLPDQGNKVFMPATSVGNTVGYQDVQGSSLSNTTQVQILTDAPKATMGGGQGVTVQAQLWTDPSYMAAVGEDLLEAYSEFLNDRIINGNRIADTAASLTGYNGILDAAFGTDSAAVPGATDVPVTGAPAAVVPLLGTAWAAVWNGSKRAPSAAIMSANMWGALLNEVDTDGRPIISNVFPTNPAGLGNAGDVAGSLRGLPVVVDDAVGDTDIIVSSFRDALLYETSGQPAQLQLTYPDVLVTDVSVFGFSSLFVRRPAAFAVMSAITIP